MLTRREQYRDRCGADEDSVEPHPRPYRAIRHIERGATTAAKERASRNESAIAFGVAGRQSSRARFPEYERFVRAERPLCLAVSPRHDRTLFDPYHRRTADELDRKDGARRRDATVRRRDRERRARRLLVERNDDAATPELEQPAFERRVDDAELGVFSSAGADARLDE
jgi:hypothetical protein